MEKRGGNRTGGWRILEIMFNARPRNDLTRFKPGRRRRGLIGREDFFPPLFLESRGKKRVTGGKCAETEKSLKSRVEESVLNCGARMTSGKTVARKMKMSQCHSPEVWFEKFFLSAEDGKLEQSTCFLSSPSPCLLLTCSRRLFSHEYGR